MHRAIIIGYAYTFGLFISIDALWLGIIAKRLYQLQIGYIMPSTPTWIAVILFYFIYPIGLMIFSLQPSQGNSRKAAMLGALFGFFTYATVELTNWAVIYKWPTPIVLIDIIWGTILSGAVCALTVWLYKKHSNYL